MELAAVYHKADKSCCYALERNRFLFRIRVKKGDMASIILHSQDKYLPLSRQDTRRQTVMERVCSDEYSDYYEAELIFQVVCLRYFFELIDQSGEKIFYTNYKFSREIVIDTDQMFDCPQNLREEERFLIPQWAKNKVVYQIFPSRFAASKEVPEELWYKAPIGHFENLQGDLRGVINRLDHLEELGVEVLYMTPIFRANTSHKYDTVDYYQIDPSFGTKEDLKELVTKAHARGMRVLLDGVFNHTSPDFFAFADVMKNQEKSEYLDWYYIEGFPLVREWGKKPNFKCFSYFGGMPKLNLSNPKVQDYCIGVARYWLRECGIDGWRLDVGDEISHVFWKRFRREVKEEKSEALIIGEVWHYAPDFLEGDEWDSVMNYPFKDAVKELLAERSITVSQFAGRLGFIRGNVHTDVYPVLFNLIGSHDCPRFLHECGGDVQRLKMAAALQLLSPGMPMIYYGDEYAMEGGKDPDCRRGMVWEESRQNREVYDWYRRLIQVRKEHPALTAGQLVSLQAEDEKGLLTIVRADGNEKTTVICNCGTQEVDLTEYAGLTELIQKKKFEGRLGAMEAAVFIGN